MKVTRLDPRKRSATAIACLLVALSVSVGVVVGPPSAEAETVVVEAEDMTGAGSTVSVSGASNGTAIETDGTRSFPAGVPAGAYQIVTRFRGSNTNARARTSVDGQRVFEFDGPANFQELPARVWIDGPDQIVSVSAVKKRPNLALQPIQIDWVSLTPTEPGYTTRGSKILSPSGEEVRWRGLQPKQLDRFELGDDDVEGLVYWGANFVRVIVDITLWLPQMCTYDPEYPGRIDRAVEKLNAVGMFVLLELHQNTRGSTCGPGGNRELADANSIPYWTEMARKYKTNEMVGFDLYNEPHNVTPTVWRNGGTAPEGYQLVGMQQLYNIVRAEGAQNLLFIGGLGYAYAIKHHLTQPINGWGFIASTHPYCHGCGGHGRDDMDTSLLPTVAAGIPVMATEFGSEYPTGTFQQEVIGWLEANNISWSAYAWAPWAPEQFGLLACYDGCYEPNVNGAPVRDFLWAANGYTADTAPRPSTYP
jgi:endoglucanase